MTIFAIIIGLLLSAIGLGMFFLLPSMFDGEYRFLWVIGVFIVCYGAAAAFVSITLNPFSV